MVGTIFRLPDDMLLQRGVTFTILPDGRSLRVPAMNRLQVRAASQSHEEGDGKHMMQALQDILMGKRSMKKRPRLDMGHEDKINPNRGRGAQRGQRAVVDPNAGFRPVMEEGEQVAEM